MFKIWKRSSNIIGFDLKRILSNGNLTEKILLSTLVKNKQKNPWILLEQIEIEAIDKNLREESSIFSTQNTFEYCPYNIPN